jgi:hypothetical protein
MPKPYNIAAHRRTARFPRLYARLERWCSSLHGVFYAWGTTEEDRLRSFPCDTYVCPPPISCYRGIEVLAPKEVVYRWLCQLQVASYAYDWFDNFGRPSPRELTPGADRLSPGQRVMFMFNVVEFTQDEHITLQGNTKYAWLPGQKIAMSYCVVPCGPTSCRIVSKVVAHHAWPTLLNRFRAFYYPILDWIMMRKQLSTIKHLAEKQFLEELADGRRLMTDGER